LDNKIRGAGAFRLEDQMKLTNNHNLPGAIIRALENDSYSRGDSDVTVTELIAPVRQVAMRRFFDDQIEEDASDRIWLLLGKLMHQMLEESGDDALTEERLYRKIPHDQLGPIVLGGQFDNLTLTEGTDGWTLTDWKLTSAWTLVFGDRLAEWETQLNAYAELLRDQTFDVDRIRVVAILRDWRQMEATRSQDYPQAAVQIVPLSVINPDEISRMMAEASIEVWEAIHAFTGSLLPTKGDQSVLPECSPAERWARPDKFAVYRNANKTATRVFESEQAAADQIVMFNREDKKPNDYRVELRPGTSVRCERYCPVADFCDQWQSIKPEDPAQSEK
jgi:hypothetical protein